MEICVCVWCSWVWVSTCFFFAQWLSLRKKFNQKSISRLWIEIESVFVFFRPIVVISKQMNELWFTANRILCVKLYYVDFGAQTEGQTHDTQSTDVTACWEWPRDRKKNKSHTVNGHFCILFIHKLEEFKYCSRDVWNLLSKMVRM